MLICGLERRYVNPLDGPAITASATILPAGKQRFNPRRVAIGRTSDAMTV